MRKTLGVLGIAVLTLTGCGSTAEDTEKSSSQQEMLKLEGGIQIDAENTIGDCEVLSPFAGKHLDQLEGSQVTIRDANDQVVATPRVETLHSDSDCVWKFETEVEQHSDFYKAEFLDLETEVMQVSEADGDVVNFDIATPLADRVDREAAESWDTNPVDSFPGN